MRIKQSLLRKLKLPKLGSHKGQNGRLLIIAGSKRFHGSLIYALKIASRIVDLIYVLTTTDNAEVIKKLKIHTTEFIPVKELGSYLKYTDCVLIGPGMGVSKNTKKLVERVLKSGAKAVLDADAINVLDRKLKKLLDRNHILTPHLREFTGLVQAPSPSSPPTGSRRYVGAGGEGEGGRRLQAVLKFVKKHPCTVVLKGKIDIVASPHKVILNKTGNQGMTKGGTGDVLAGLIAAFYCKNDVFTSAAAGAYLNGLAGDQLFKKVGPYYNAEDLVNQIPLMLWNLVKSKSQTLRQAQGIIAPERAVASRRIGACNL